MNDSLINIYLQVIEEEGLQANCADVGTYFLLELAKVRDEFEVVGDVRGKGLMIGIELVADKVSATVLLFLLVSACLTGVSINHRYTRDNRLLIPSHVMVLSAMGLILGSSGFC